jgi:hypothetical protein
MAISNLFISLDSYIRVEQQEVPQMLRLLDQTTIH